jgi:hypothetical protein
MEIENYTNDAAWYIELTEELRREVEQGKKHEGDIMQVVKRRADSLFAQGRAPIHGVKVTLKIPYKDFESNANLEI